MRADEDAKFDARLIEAVGRGIADIEAGRYVTSVEEAFAHARSDVDAHLADSEHETFDAPQEFFSVVEL